METSIVKGLETEDYRKALSTSYGSAFLAGEKRFDVTDASIDAIVQAELPHSFGSETFKVLLQLHNAVSKTDLLRLPTVVKAYVPFEPETMMVRAAEHEEQLAMQALKYIWDERIKRWESLDPGEKTRIPKPDYPSPRYIAKIPTKPAFIREWVQGKTLESFLEMFNSKLAKLEENQDYKQAAILRENRRMYALAAVSRMADIIGSLNANQNAFNELYNNLVNFFGPSESWYGRRLMQYLRKIAVKRGSFGVDDAKLHELNDLYAKSPIYKLLSAEPKRIILGDTHPGNFVIRTNERFLENNEGKYQLPERFCSQVMTEPEFRELIESICFIDFGTLRTGNVLFDLANFDHPTAKSNRKALKRNLQEFDSVLSTHLPEIRFPGKDMKIGDWRRMRGNDLDSMSALAYLRGAANNKNKENIAQYLGKFSLVGVNVPEMQPFVNKTKEILKI